MIGYATMGTSDLEKARSFYDTFFSIIGAKRAGESERHTLWQSPSGGPKIGVYLPYNNAPATSGNGQMIGIAVDTKEQVDQLYTKAIELGGQDEGPPGPRVEGKFYMAYFRDLDGNRISLFNKI